MKKKIKMVLHLIVPPHMEIKHGISNLFLKYLSMYDFLNTNFLYSWPKHPERRYYLPLKVPDDLDK